MSYICSFKELSWPIKFIKLQGARPGLKRPAQITMQQMQKKNLNMKKRKGLNGFTTQNGEKVVPG